MKYLVLSLACGDIYSQAGCGAIKNQNDRSLKRFRASIKKVDCNETIFICTAGYSKSSPRKAVSKRVVSLSEQMLRYISEHHSDFSDCFIAKPLCWSTINEVRLDIKEVQRRGLIAKNDKDVTLVVASNLLHLLRLRLYVFFYKPQAWQSKFIVVKKKFDPIDSLAEVIKFSRDLRKLWKIWRRFKRIGRFKRVRKFKNP